MAKATQGSRLGRFLSVLRGFHIHFFRALAAHCCSHARLPYLAELKNTACDHSPTEEGEPPTSGPPQSRSRGSLHSARLEAYSDLHTPPNSFPCKTPPKVMT